MTEQIGSFLVVWHTDGTGYQIRAQHAPTIRDAVTRWLREGYDQVVDLTALSGDGFCIKASCIDSWTLSTPEGRAAKQEIDARLYDSPDEEW